jgi:hypothetical protein
MFKVRESGNKSTNNMLNLLKNKNKPVKVVTFDK